MATCSYCGCTLGYDCDCLPLADECSVCGNEVFASEWTGDTDTDGRPVHAHCAHDDGVNRQEREAA
jgi:hypothetical protein